jgi:mannose-6-phosphate isomerase-like protein (cupin superfamily)
MTASVSNLDRDHLRREDNCHEGAGSVLVFRPYLRGPGAELVDFIDLVVVPSGASIGRHRHGDNTEWYVILQGCGSMWFGGSERTVASGDILINPPFAEHGLENRSGEDIRLLVFQLSAGAAA